MTSPQPTALPYGMRDCKLTPYTDGQGSILAGTSVDLPNMTTYSFSETEEFEELRGDDRVIATRGNGAKVEFEIEAGGISFAAWSVLTGGSVVESGTAPNRKRVIRKKSTDARPYFRSNGRAISDSGGDVHTVVYRNKVSDSVEGEFGDGAFFMTKCKGTGLPMLDEGYDILYDFVQNETAVPLTLTPTPNPLAPPSGVAAGTLTAVTAIINWNTVVAATGYQVEKSADGITGWTNATGGTVVTNVGTTTITGLVTATTTYFRVRSTGPGGPSDPSLVISITQP